MNKIGNLHSQCMYRLRRLSVFFGIVCSLFLSSCSEDPIASADKLPAVPEGYVRTALNLYIESNNQVGTRASDTEEKAYDKNNVWVLVFDQNAPSSTAQLMQAPIKATVNGAQLFALLRATGAARKVYVVAGLTTAMNNALAAITPASVDAGGVTWNTVNSILYTTPVPASGIPIGGGNYFPMCTDVIDRPTGTATLTEITANFKRVVAKVDVKCPVVTVLPKALPAQADFQLTGVRLWNAPARAYVLPQGTMAADLGGEQTYDEVTSVTDNAVSSQIYLYENNKDNAGTNNNPTTLIIKGRYNGSTVDSYYRVDLLNTTQTAPNRIPLSIERNTQYTVKVSKVEAAGYATAAEAYANGPSNNIDFNIEVTIPTPHDIVSNGQYFLGLSNSELIVYSSEANTSITVAEVAHSAPSSVNQGTVTITRLVGTAPTNISNPFTVRNGSPQRANLTMTLPQAFVSCDVVLYLGNLKQTIRVERRYDTLAFGGYTLLGNQFAYGSFPTSVAWAKLSNKATDDVLQGLNEVNCTPGQPVYMILDDNIAIDPGAANRSCEIYLSGGKASGRTKVFVDQPKFDIISQGAPNVFKDTYVGTFHRHDQLGERLIRMSSTNNQFWMAQVVVGKDFIRLDDQPTIDSKIYSPAFGDAERYPVDGEKTKITGTGAIEFRVGLTGTIPADQVRYGLITVTHSGGVNRIFVRQGEKADYVMRPENPIHSSSGSLIQASRPLAKAFSPFNLTDPSGRTGVRVDLKGHLGTWVQYPSQAGYLFQANTPYAWAPDANAGNYNSDFTPVAGYDQVCPTGYRRVKDGNNGTDGFATTSEMRQSLWYYPKDGLGKSDYENTIRGLLADGFFDRQTATQATAHAYKTNMVGSGAERAYIGVLIFNPHNYASIFIPAAGTIDRNLNPGRLTNPGLDAIWWSSTYKDGASGNYLYGSMEYLNTGFTYDNSFGSAAMGASVRCVVDPSAP